MSHARPSVPGRPTAPGSTTGHCVATGSLGVTSARTSARFLVMLLVALAAALVAVVAVAPVPAWPATPSGSSEVLRLGSTTLVVGQTGTLDGSGWPRGSAVQTVLCGALADQGSVDCANAAAVTVAPGPDGSLQASFPVVVPPAPCPCVVLAQGKDVDYLERFAVDLVEPGGAAPPSPPSTGGGPAIVVLPSTAPVGATVGVLGSGFPPGRTLELVVCGDLGLGGTGDCVAHPTRTSATAHGVLAARVTVRPPPVPCPCDLEALAPGRSPVLAPLAVLGAPAGEAAPEAPLFADLEVEGASLRGAESWTAAFGSSTTRRLVLVLANRGGLATGPMSLRLRLVTGTGASRLVVDRTLATVAPGGRATYHVPVTVAAMTIGTVAWRGTVGVDGQKVPFAVTARSVPWGLVAVLALVVLAGLATAVVVVRRRVGRRLGRRVGRSAAGSPGTEPAAAEASSVDTPQTERDRPAAGPPVGKHASGGTDPSPPVATTKSSEGSKSGTTQADRRAKDELQRP